MRILVTGAAGFLGWNLTRELRRRSPNAYILGVDNLWTGVRRIEEYVSDMVIADIERLGEVQYPTYDEVWHLASPASPQHYQDRPHDTVRANVIGMFRCLELVRPGGMLFYASTSEVYGDPLVSPQPESYKGSVSCTGPRACYDESKRMAECILLDAVRMGQLVQPKIVRLFNVYGPGTLESDGRAMSNFVCQALRGQDITVMGDGMQTRCFTYVDDVIEAMMRMARGTGQFAGPVNIGTDVETTVLEIARAVGCLVTSRHLDHPSHIVHVPAAVDDPRQRLPELTLCRKMLSWQATTTYGEGIQRTAEYFRKELGL